MTTKDRQPDPRALNVSAFCRHGHTAAGDWPVSSMPRLASGLLASPQNNVAWSAQGQLVKTAGAAPQDWLHLTAQTQVALTCQRCLQPLSQTVQVDRRFRFVGNEDEAARLDEEAEDDVLVMPARLDLHSLLEDELILALPLVPRHDNCPQPLPMVAAAADDALAEAEAPHPFAALAALRGGGAGSGGGSGGGTGGAGPH